MKRRPPPKGGGSAGALRVTIPWAGAPPSIAPLLDVRSCYGLRGPWSGTLNIGPTTGIAPQSVRFSLGASLDGVLDGHASAARPQPEGAPGEVDQLNLSWHIPIPSPPASNRRWPVHRPRVMR
jgi:hypothetical protein